MRLAVILSLLFLPSLARAAEAPTSAETAAAADAKRAEAKSRYEAGAAAYAAGHFKDAVDLFLDADRLAPSAPLSFNIARAYEKLGDDSGALRWYRDYLRRAPTASNGKEVEATVANLEGRLAQKGIQQLTVLSTPAGATVEIDDRPVGVTPWTGDLAPGTHRVSLSLRGYEDQTVELALSALRSQDVSLRLVMKTEKPAGAPVAAAAAPAAAPAAPADKPAESKSEGLGIWPWVTVGAGGVALAGALTFELLRKSSESAAEKEQTQVGYKEKLDQMESRQTTARVLAGVGGALVIAGGVMIVLDQSSSSKSKQATSLVLSPTQGGVFLGATGTY